MLVSVQSTGKPDPTLHAWLQDRLVVAGEQVHKRTLQSGTPSCEDPDCLGNLARQTGAALLISVENEPLVGRWRRVRTWLYDSRTRELPERTGKCDTNTLQECVREQTWKLLEVHRNPGQQQGSGSELKVPPDNFAPPPPPVSPEPDRPDPPSPNARAIRLGVAGSLAGLAGVLLITGISLHAINNRADLDESCPRTIQPPGLTEPSTLMTCVHDTRSPAIVLDVVGAVAAATSVALFTLPYLRRTSAPRDKRGGLQ